MSISTGHARFLTFGSKSSRDRLSVTVGLGAVILAIAALIVTGIIGFGRTSPPDVDLDYYYTAGRMLLAGENPYDASIFVPRLTAFSQKEIHEGGVWAYPPAMTALSALLALLPHTLSHWLLTAMNLAAVGVLARLSMNLLRHPAAPRPFAGTTIAPWIVAALVIGNPFTARAIWLVQIVPIVAACVLGCWMIVQRHTVASQSATVRSRSAGQPSATVRSRSADPPSSTARSHPADPYNAAWARQATLAGILLGIALLKPTLALLPAFWLLLERQWRVLFTAAAVVIVLSLPTVLAIGQPFWSSWLHAMELYQACPFDFLGADHLLGLPSFIVAIGGPATGATYALPLAALAALLLWTQRQRFPSDDRYPILMSLQFGVVYGHPPDLIAWLPGASALWLHLSRKPLTWPFLALGLALLCLPWRVLEMVGLSAVARFGQTPIVLVVLVAFLALGYRWNRSNRIVSRGSRATTHQTPNRPFDHAKKQSQAIRSTE